MKEKKKAKRCATKFCRGVAFPNAHSPYCSRCRSRRFRSAHPCEAHFLDLKNRARQRGHEFTITLEYYREVIWFGSGYAEKHGKTAASLSVDRIESHLGYVPGNLRVLTLSQNARRNFVPYFTSQKPRDEQDIRDAEAAVAASMNDPELRR